MANSSPIAPPPIIAILSGNLSKLKASVLVITPAEFIPSIFCIKGSDPEAIINFWQLTSISLSLVATIIFFEFIIVPVPYNTLIPL